MVWHLGCDLQSAKNSHNLSVEPGDSQQGKDRWSIMQERPFFFLLKPFQVRHEGRQATIYVETAKNDALYLGASPMLSIR